MRRASSVKSRPWPPCQARVFMLAPAIISAGARWTGDIDHALDQARTRLAEALDRIPGDLDAAGKISDAEPLEAIEDAVATFAPDQIIISTRAEQTSVDSIRSSRASRGRGSRYR